MKFEEVLKRELTFHGLAYTPKHYGWGRYDFIDADGRVRAQMQRSKKKGMVLQIGGCEYKYGYGAIAGMVARLAVSR